MSDVASLELCRELYELSSWGKDGYEQVDWYFRYGKHLPADKKLWGIAPDASMGEFPAYNLGYLLRKLEASKKTVTVMYHSLEQPLSMDLKEWAGMYTASTADMPQREYPYAGVPEDATAKLAIELFKRGILKKEVL